MQGCCARLILDRLGKAAGFDSRICLAAGRQFGAHAGRRQRGDAAAGRIVAATAARQLADSDTSAQPLCQSGMYSITGGCLNSVKHALWCAIPYPSLVSVFSCVAAFWFSTKQEFKWCFKARSNWL